MQIHEFENQMKRLKIVYGEKTFPPEREGMFWKRFQRVPAKAFEYAVDWIVLSMPSQGQIVVALDDKLRDAKIEKGADSQREPKYTCEPCRDFGYGWIGHTIVACVCDLGSRISPAELVKQQANYDRGRRFLKTPADLAKLLGRETG